MLPIGDFFSHQEVRLDEKSPFLHLDLMGPTSEKMGNFGTKTTLKKRGPLPAVLVSPGRSIRSTVAT